MNKITQCIVYKSLRKQDTYLFISIEDDFSCVPQALLQTLGKVEKVMALQLTPEKKLAQSETRHVIAELDSKGFYLQLPPKHLTAAS